MFTRYNGPGSGLNRQAQPERGARTCLGLQVVKENQTGTQPLFQRAFCGGKTQASLHLLHVVRWNIMLNSVTFFFLIDDCRTK